MNVLSKFSMSVPLFLSENEWQGRRPNGKFKVLILTTRGRKSREIHITPVGYFEYDRGYLVVASNAGHASNPAWYYNIPCNPNDVEIQVMDKKMKVTPQIILGEPRRYMTGSSPSHPTSVPMKKERRAKFRWCC